ncbi:hypothetical protein BTO06_09990 [Tenacibaculum sp. SZ-18]|uniref:hypothetical protein n=1 Tax=Tenacibaculum sp. SZ-18 TaxID=754423 RepID=UPI000C2D673E|nr:hypothetical protein [Tenacibaculum sp. SZ-18]AUC15451.1 hypothetical protein BTO06_09990 [Tenacibaculum sp. SZ-18]
METSLKIQDLSITGEIMTSQKELKLNKVLPFSLLVEIKSTLENSQISLFSDTATVLTDDSDLVIDATVNIDGDSEEIYVYKNEEEIELTQKQADYIIGFMKGFHAYHFSGSVNTSYSYDMYDYNGVKLVDFV